jgi:hypothetical protein
MTLPPRSTIPSAACRALRCSCLALRRCASNCAPACSHQSRGKNGAMFGGTYVTTLPCSSTSIETRSISLQRLRLETGELPSIACDVASARYRRQDTPPSWWIKAVPHTGPHRLYRSSTSVVFTNALELPAYDISILGGVDEARTSGSQSRSKLQICLQDRDKVTTTWERPCLCKRSCVRSTRSPG